MNSLLKQYSVDFTSDGESTVVEIDTSVVPVSEDFRGNAPTAVSQQAVTGEGITGNLPNTTATLQGTTVTITLPAALPQYDANQNLIIYNVTFYLQYGG